MPAGQAISGDDADRALNPTLQALIDAARSEAGKLRFDWPLGITEALDEWQRAFNDTFGVEIDIQYNSYVESSSALVDLLQTAKEDRPASSDVFLGPFALFLRGGPQGPDLFEPVDWRSIAPDWPDGVVSPDSISVVAYHQLVGFAYNTQLLDRSDVPKTSADVVTLAAKRPVASTPHAAGFPFLGSEDLMGREGILAHLREFARVKAGLIEPAEVHRVAKGDFVGLWLNGANNFVDLAQARGAPVAATVLRDAAFTIAWEMAVPRNASRPNTAKLWIYFMNTARAQEIAYKNAFADNALLEGSRVAQTISDYETDGIQFVHFNYEYGLQHPEVYDEQIREQIIEVLTAGN